MNSPSFLIRFPGVVLCAALLAFAGRPCELSAQEDRRLSLEAIQRLDVPEDRPNEWPFRDQTWIPMARDDFERLLARRVPAKLAPPRAAIRQVRYTATLVGDTLVSGRFHARLQRLDERTRFLSLGAPTLAIDELAWNGRPARWGAALDGRQWLALDSAGEELDGRWSARGRELDSAVAFELELLPAAVSELELLTPAGQTVTTNVGNVALQPDSGDAALARWRIDLGKETQCRILVSTQEPRPPVAPTLLYEQELSAVVGQDELQLRQTFQADALDGEVQRLTISLPRLVEIVSATYGDAAQTALKFERISGEGPAAQVLVTLPEKTRGRLPPIRLEGFQRRGAGELLSVPHFAIEGGVWLDGRVNVTVARPLELRSYRGTGFRQRLPVAQRLEGEALSFQQLSPRPQLLLNVERPAVERQAHVLNLLTSDRRWWTLTAEIAWESRSGTVYDASCRLPDGWRVVSVVQLGGGRESQELADWDVQPHAESGQVLHLEFPDGLTPGRVGPVRIVAQRDLAAGQTLTQAPLALPLDCEQTEVLLHVAAQTQLEFPRTARDQWEPFDVQSAAAVWNTLPSWSDVVGAAGGSSRLLHVIHADSYVPLIVDDALARMPVTADVSLVLAAGRINEQYRIQFKQRSPAAREAELRFAANAASIAWTWGEGGPPATLRKISPRELADPSQVAGAGEFYRVALPDQATDDVTLIGQREVSWTDSYSIPLVDVPQARGFQGTVTLAADQDDAYRLRESPVVESPLDADRADQPISTQPRTWSYRQGDRGWQVQVRRRRDPATVPMDYALKSVLAQAASAFDYHQLTATAREAAEFDGVRFQLPETAELLAATFNRQPAALTRAGREYVIATNDRPAIGNAFTLLYRVPVTAAAAHIRHRLELPTVPWPCAHFVWRIGTPPATEFREAPCGLALSPRPPRWEWWRRLLGPLGRPATHSPSDAARLPVPARAPITEPSSTGLPDTSAAAVEFPPGWEIWTARGTELPAPQDFVAWDRDALNLLNWVLLFACFPVGLLLRRRPGTLPLRLFALTCAAAACLAVFGPEVWNVAAGSVCSGLVISLLLPEIRLRSASATQTAAPDASASTEIFRRAALPLMLFLSCGVGISWLSAQERAPATVNPGAQPGAKPQPYRVLVPIDRDRKPSQQLPVVYLSPALHDALSQSADADHAEPRQLISAAEYLVSRDEQGRTALKIRYVIDRWLAAGEPVLQLPLSRNWRGGLESCTVDGRARAVTGGLDDEFLTVSLEDDAPAEDRVQRHEVLLRIRLQNSLEPLEGDFRAEIFPVLNSRWSWQSMEGMRFVELPEARGSVTISLDRRLAEAQLGAIRELTFRRSRDEPLPINESRTESLILQQIGLRPTATLAAFRVECRVVEGGVRRLELELPAGGVLREIRGQRVLRTFVHPAAENGARAVVEFLEPQLQTVVVEGEYVLPRPAPDQAVEFPRLQVRCGRPAAAPRHFAAVGCDPEHRVQLVNLDDPAVLPVPVEQFFTQWGDTLPSQQSQLAFQVQDGGQPAFRLVPVPAEQELLSWQEHVAVSRRKLDWTLTADLKSTVWPALSFAVLLDRRLTIEAVAVRENGTEQRVRWSKTPMIGSSLNRVTLFLNRETSGLCQIVIRGGLRVRSSSPVALPSVRFETPQSVPGVLTLVHEPGHRLLLEGKQSETEPNNSGTDPAHDPAPLVFFRRLKIQEGDSGLVARLEPASGKCLAQSLWLIAPGESAWKIQGGMELTPEDGTREISVVIPDWLHATRPTLPPGWPALEESQEDGQRTFRVTWPANNSDPVVLGWSLELPPPKESSVARKLPRALHSVHSEDWAAILPQPDWTISAGASREITAAPVVLRELLRSWNAAAVEALSQVSDGVLTLSHLDRQSPDGRSSIRLAVHTLRTTRGGGWEGQSEFYPELTAGVVEVAVPESIQLHQLSADDAVLPLAEAAAESGRVRIAAAGRYRRLVLRWTMAPQTPSSPLSQFTTFLPHCVQERQPKTLLAWSAAGGDWLVIPRTPQRISRWEFASDRLMNAVERVQQLRESQVPDPQGEAEIWRAYRALETALAAPNAVERLTPADRERWESIVRAVSRIENPVGRSGHDSLTPENEFDIVADPDAKFGLLAEGTGQLTSWAIPRTLLYWTAAGLLLILLAGLVAKLAGWLVSPWWQEHRHAGWLLFGFVWWWCWSPPLLGLAMMAWALADWLRERRTTAAAIAAQ